MMIGIHRLIDALCVCMRVRGMKERRLYISWSFSSFLRALGSYILKYIRYQETLRGPNGAVIDRYVVPQRGTVDILLTSQHLFLSRNLSSFD